MDLNPTFLPPTKDYSATCPAFQIRRRVACSLIKQLKLGKDHKPFQAQHGPMAKRLQPEQLKEFGKAIWRGWWTGRTQPQPNKQKLLDKVYGTEDYVSSLLMGTPGPRSPLHMHMDALDAAVYFGKDASWEDIRRNKALAVLNELHQKWRPENNRVPGAFPHDWVRIEFDEQPADEARNALTKDGDSSHRSYHALLNVTERLSESVLQAYDYHSPACMPGFLFAVGHDIEFMSEDKIDVWAMDLATAALALWGLLYADRYDMIGGQREYTWLWRQLSALFWMEQDEQVSERKFLLLLVELQCTTESEVVLEIFGRARKSYVRALELLGLLPSDIKVIFDRPGDVRPRIYYGGNMKNHEEDESPSY